LSTVPVIKVEPSLKRGKEFAADERANPFSHGISFFAVVGTTQMVGVSNKYHANHRAPACGSA
jgi:hypothetical protein